MLDLRQEIHVHTIAKIRTMDKNLFLAFMKGALDCVNSKRKDVTFGLLNFLNFSQNYLRVVSRKMIYIMFFQIGSNFSTLRAE